MSALGLLKLAFHHRGSLGRISRNPAIVEKITPAYLKSFGADAVILDHDGILGAARSARPDHVGEILLADMVREFGDGKVFILSNTRSAKSLRTQTYQTSYPDVVYINSRRKPDPEGLQSAAKICGAPINKIAVVDDGLLTGVLMAVDSGAIPVYALRERIEETFTTKVMRLGVTMPQLALVRLFSLFA